MSCAPESRGFYIDVLTHLSLSQTPFLVGGALALERYTGIERQTKDVDLFLRQQNVPDTLDLFRELGYRTELPFPHWLAKIYGDNEYVDLIFNSGDGVAKVDDGWFEHAVDTTVLGINVRLCPAEETIWSKAFVQERERFDGADVLHLLHRLATTLNWPRLLWRFGPHWRVLFGHLVLFGFVYPDRRETIPAWVVEEFTTRLRSERNEGGLGDAAGTKPICNGTLLSREQYLSDVSEMYEDGRLKPYGTLTREQIEIWTAAIENLKSLK